jgi:hypothetical protein
MARNEPWMIWLIELWIWVLLGSTPSMDGGWLGAIWRRSPDSLLLAAGSRLIPPPAAAGECRRPGGGLWKVKNIGPPLEGFVGPRRSSS